MPKPPLSKWDSYDTWDLRLSMSAHTHILIIFKCVGTSLFSSLLMFCHAARHLLQGNPLPVQSMSSNWRWAENWDWSENFLLRRPTQIPVSSFLLLGGWDVDINWQLCHLPIYSVLELSAQLIISAALCGSSSLRGLFDHVSLYSHCCPRTSGFQIPLLS